MATWLGLRWIGKWHPMRAIRIGFAVPRDKPSEDPHNDDDGVSHRVVCENAPIILRSRLNRLPLRKRRPARIGSAGRQALARGGTVARGGHGRTNFLGRPRGSPSFMPSRRALAITAAREGAPSSAAICREEALAALCAQHFHSLGGQRKGQSGVMRKRLLPGAGIAACWTSGRTADRPRPRPSPAVERIRMPSRCIFALTEALVVPSDSQCPASIACGRTCAALECPRGSSGRGRAGKSCGVPFLRAPKVRAKLMQRDARHGGNVVRSGRRNTPPLRDCLIGD